MKHAILIRLHYAADDPRVAWRFALFEAMCLRGLKQQTVADFSIVVLCCQHHADRLAAMDPRIIPCIGAFDPKPWDAQTRIDSDHLVRPEFVQRIMQEIAHAPGEPCVVSFQPYKRNLDGFCRFRMGLRYRRGQCSAIACLYQPDPARRKPIMEWNHLRLGSAAKRFVQIPEGYCEILIHNDNLTTRISRGDRRI